ncbi:methyltransferase domain-containing protein [Candidatus Berkelbacteria bacterium]|nr:methyltransferase domain-containing protein [Candidatus Berkelbacteria bacterium]
MVLIIAFIIMLMALGILCFAIFALIALAVGAPYVPSSSERVRRMTVLANISPGDHVVDLGSGDGRLLVAAARRGAHVTGIEINPILVIISRAWLFLKFHSAKHRVLFGDFRRFSLKTADIIFCYHLPGKMAALERQIRAEAKPGAIIILNAFPFPGLKPRQISNNLYVYVVETPDSK